MSIITIGILAMEKMQEAGIPIDSFITNGEQGFDFVFSRGLTDAEQLIAQEIANEYLPTIYSWHVDLQCV